MTLYEFLVENENDQYQLVWDSGQYISSCVQGDFRIHLYAIDTFFIEIYYDTKTNTIVDKKTFTHGLLMDKYCPEINSFL